jgi:hypothetical protein
MDINKTATKALPFPDDPVSGKFCSASDELAARRGVDEVVGAAVTEAWVVGVAWAVVVVVGRAVVVVVGKAGPDL